MKVCPACSREYPNEHTVCRDDGVALVHLDTGTTGRSQDLIGQIVDGRYRIERVVGRGGMGTVYACRHVVVGKSFAMKVLRSGIERSEEILQRFIREAQAANAVRSRHICEMSDFGQLPGGAFYVVMELLDGESLTRALRDKRLDRTAIKHVFIQIAETLDRAHRAGIIHRDLKPDNVVLVEDEGDPHFVKLVDFGIAKMMQSKASNLTETGVILGTPYYMSPEQARGEQLDHRSDIYALGVMMYRAFTGRLPFVADTAMGVLTRHLTEKPELPSRLAEMDHALERLILRCLEKKPIDRFQSMADVAHALRSVSDRPQRRAEANPTIDERTGGLSAPIPRRRQPTPTEVATPIARKEAARVGGMDPPPTRPEPYAMPHAMPAPPMPSNMGSGQAPHPPGMGTPTSGSHPLASGEFALSGQSPGVSGAMAGATSGTHSPPSFIEPEVSDLRGSFGPSSASGSDLPVHLQGEAATNRGVVSSRISVVARPKGNRIALAGLAASLLVVFVVVAVAVLGSDEGDPAAGDKTGSAEPDGLQAPPSIDEPEESPPEADPEPEPSATSTAIEGAEGGAAPEPSASAKAAPSPVPVYRPQPPKPKPEPEEPEGPMPEIRSPFED